MTGLGLLVVLNAVALAGWEAGGVVIGVFWCLRAAALVSGHGRVP